MSTEGPARPALTRLDLAPTDLPRVLNSAHAAAIVVGIIIGSGIFLVPREMIAAVGTSRGVYAVWLTGGILSLFGAMSYAELAAMRPRVGGEYAFLREAYGDLTAFLYTWTWITIAKPASLATIAVGLMRVLGTFHALAFLSEPAFGHLLWSQIAGLLALWCVTGLNIVSTLESANAATVLTWLKISLIVVIALVCFGFGGTHGSFAHFSTIHPGARGGIAGFMTALIAALWAYDGWSDVTQMAGEVKEPQRALPLALVGGVALVGVLYMLTNAAVQFILPASVVASSDRPAAQALQVVAGSAGTALVSVAMAVSICATFVGSSLSGARIPFAAARDGLLPRALTGVHPRFHTPWKSLLLQAVISSVLLLAVGRFQALFSLAIVSEWLFYALTAASVFVLRRREPDLPRPYRVTGYPVVPALFVLAAATLLLFSLVESPVNFLLGSAAILLGIPVFWLQTHRGRPLAS